MTHADGGEVLDRILQDTPATLAVTFYDDEDAVDDGTVTVTIAGRTGDQIATGAAAGDEAGNYTFALNGQSDLGRLQITWQGATRRIVTYAEIVGGFYFTLRAARDYDDALTADKYDTATLKRARTAVEAEFERITDVSFVPRYGRAYFHRRRHKHGRDYQGNLESQTQLAIMPAPRRLLSVTIDGVAQTTDYMAALQLDPDGYLDGIRHGEEVVVEYEYGYDAPPPDIYRVALVYLRYLLTSTRGIVPDRATQFTATEGGTYQLALPGRSGYETGIPDVDAVLGRWSYKAPGVA